MRYLPFIPLLLLLVVVMGSLGPTGSRRAGLQQMRSILLAIAGVFAFAVLFSLLVRGSL
ncbi:MAG: hypothetical protein M3345_04575 [Actinomycetota bacterium]|nr:hypothetical protein [Actinomycetota bacterium]